MEWCDEKNELLINFSSQNTFLFGVKLSDYHSRMKRAASRSSAIINFDAINRRQFFSCQVHGTKNWRQNLAFMALVSGSCVRGLRHCAAVAESHDDEDAETQTTFFCSLSITGLILQHTNAKLPPGIMSTYTDHHCWHLILKCLKFKANVSSSVSAKIIRPFPH